MEQNRRRKASNGTRPARPTTSPRTTNPAKATKPTKSTKAVKSAKSPTPPAKPRKPSGPRKYRKTVWLPIGRTSVRIRVFMVIVGVLLGTAGLRAIQVQGIDSTAMADEAAKKMQSSRDLPAARGDIVDRNGVTLATTEPAMIVSIDPDMIRTNGEIGRAHV